MKYLYVMRHAKAMSISSSDFSDLTRALTAEGEQDARAIGEYLKKLGCVHQCVLTSPALRTQMTTQELLKAFSVTMPALISDEELYNASMETLVRVVKGIPEQYQSAYLVGHNPGVSQLVEYLTGVPIASMPPAGVYLLMLSIDNWHAVKKISAEIALYLTPSLLQRDDSF